MSENMDSSEARACRAWPILAKVSKDRTTVTYGQLATAIGMHHRPLRFVLGKIQEYCMVENFPPLTILVVSQAGARQPGTGFIAWDGDPKEGIRRVHAFDWSALPNPFGYAADGTTQDELATRLLEHPDRAEDVYARVKVRGTAQAIFRSALLEAYDHACAFCGLSFLEALDAAHILPWSVARPKDRLNVRNGLLLCANHHRIFDNGSLALTTDLRIQYYDPDKLDGPYSRMDTISSALLHGRELQYLPQNPKLHPDPKLIAARREHLSEADGEE